MITEILLAIIIVLELVVIYNQKKKVKFSIKGSDIVSKLNRPYGRFGNDPEKTGIQ